MHTYIIVVIVVIVVIIVGSVIGLIPKQLFACETRHNPAPRPVEILQMRTIRGLFVRHISGYEYSGKSRNMLGEYPVHANNSRSRR